MTTVEIVVDGRLRVVKRSLTRHRLVFVQCGATFRPIKNELLGRLGAPVVRASDLLGAAYEFLINMFAESAGKKGGDFYTPRDVIRPALPGRGCIT